MCKYYNIIIPKFNENQAIFIQIDILNGLFGIEIGLLRLNVRSHAEAKKVSMSKMALLKTMAGIDLPKGLTI